MANQNQKINKPITIKCPWCGAEYVPAEIFNPTDLEGKPETVLRDALGKVVLADYEEGYSPEQVAKYVCDYCNKPFVVEPTVSYKAKKEAEELDFSSDTTSLI